MKPGKGEGRSKMSGLPPARCHLLATPVALEEAHRQKRPNEDTVDIRKLTRDQRRELYDAVLLMAIRLARSRAIAEDLTQQAFLRLDTTRPWDGSRSPSIEQHMFGVLKSLLSHNGMGSLAAAFLAVRVQGKSRRRP